jgi:hypothetical protein
MQIKSIIQKINSRQFTNNTQRVGLRLLSANGEWLVRSQLGKIPSATSRVRDLRLSKFGGFAVECASSDSLAKKTNRRTFYYRIDPTKVSSKQIQTLFSV